MQKVNVNTPITITGRHVEVTDAIREFVTKKIEGIRLDFPRIMEVKVLLDVQRDRKISQVILFCSDHITIDASTEGTDMYACIDETITKIMRRMRKHKTRLMKNFRPHHQETIRKLDETVYDDSVLDYPGDSRKTRNPCSFTEKATISKSFTRKKPSWNWNFPISHSYSIGMRGETCSRSCTGGRTGTTPSLSLGAACKRKKRF